MTTTPVTTSTIPTTAGRSSLCPMNAQPITVISTVPTPDHTA